MNEFLYLPFFLQKSIDNLELNEEEAHYQYKFTSNFGITSQEKKNKLFYNIIELILNIYIL